jgi:apolipoprotein N-acyltransferase
MAVAVGSNGAAAVAVAEQSWRPSVRVVLAVTSGLCLAAAFPTLDLEPLAWVGLVPLLVAARGLRPAAAFRVGWIGGLAFYLATVYWVAYTITKYTAVSPIAAAGILVLMASALACYTGAFVAGVRWLEDRRLPVVWLAPLLWVTLEWLRSWFFIGFPWAALGYSQYRYHDLVQAVEVTGVYGVSALLVFFNAVIAEIVRGRGSSGRPRRLVPALVVLTALVAGVPLWGRWRAATLARRPPAGALRVAIAQGDIEQDHKWDPAYQDETMARYRSLTAGAAEQGAALVVWPETATPFFFQQPGVLREGVLDIASGNRVHLLFGSPAFRHDRSGVLQEMNRAYLVSPDGREVASYDKIQLVPFGEYVPYARVLFFVNRIVEAVGTIVPGVAASVLELPTARFGVLICYEDVFPALTRRFIAGGADFLVNITNDAWYGPTSAPHQHLAQATFRAIENRVPLVRAANTGISAVIDPDGRVRWRGPLFATVFHVDEIAWPGVRTFYTRFGDVFAWACALASLAAFGYGAARGRG